MFRRLPINLTKETLLDILRKRNISPVWMEELIQIDNFKYTLCKVSFLDDAFELCSRFQINSPLKEVKVNLHPKSCKAWKRDHEEFLTWTHYCYIIYIKKACIISLIFGTHSNTSTATTQRHSILAKYFISQEEWYLFKFYFYLSIYHSVFAATTASSFNLLYSACFSASFFCS